MAGVVAFGVVSYAVNPGIAATFPWLSTLANRFESYKFKKLHFVYETEKSASTNGSVQGMIDYDASENPPATKIDFMSSANAVRSAVWQEFRFNATPANLHKMVAERYTRSTTLPANLDIKTYDVGTFHFGSSGCADTSSVGELYVEYEVELLTPQIPVADTVEQTVFEYIIPAGTMVTTNVFGSAPTYLGPAYATAETNTLTFSVPGTYIVLGLGTFTCTTRSGTSTIDVDYFNGSTNKWGIVTADQVGETLIFDNVTAIVLGKMPLWSITIATPQALAALMERLKRLPTLSTIPVFTQDLRASIQLTPEEKQSGGWLKVSGY